jgi:hypothetical protein
MRLGRGQSGWQCPVVRSQQRVVNSTRQLPFDKRTQN